MFHLSINPEGEKLRPAAQPYRDRPQDCTAGLGVVRADNWTVQSRDTAALRALAAALVEAADLADAITAEHNVRVPA